MMFGGQGAYGPQLPPPKPRTPNGKIRWDYETCGRLEKAVEGLWIRIKEKPLEMYVAPHMLYIA